MYLRQPSKGTAKEISTKEKIFNAAVKLFSEKGYMEISMREIADITGITVAGLYNHYASKEDILYSLYDFYTNHWKEKCPDLNDLLELTEIETPYDIFSRFIFHFDPVLIDTMDRIVRIAIRRIGIDARSEALIRDHVASTKIVVPVLERLVELGKIEPIDVGCFATTLIMVNVYSAFVNGSNLQLSLEQWRKSYEMVFSVIKIRPNKDWKSK